MSSWSPWIKLRGGSQQMLIHTVNTISSTSSPLICYRSPNLQFQLLALENLKIVAQRGETCIPYSVINQEYAELIQDSKYLSEPEPREFVVDEVAERVGYIKQYVGSIEDGRISASPYDTAWVGLIQDDDIHETKTPRFPSCLEWIANNQFPDGSWGDAHCYSAYDRLLNTLACVVALKTWNIHHQKAQKGISFINDNIYMLEMESDAHMTIGFEVVFPSLIERAKSLGIEISDDSPVIRKIFSARQLKLTMIPKEILHSMHTTLLFSLEGLQGLEWEKLLKLQSPDGSFLTSVSSTAFAFMHTNDDKCLNFLAQVVEKFNGGVPHCYPSDIFSGSWAVDRLQRLGISCYFQPEIKNFLSRVYRHWMENPRRGLFSASNTPFADLDDTAMVFRLLRLHGYRVSAEQFTPEVSKNVESRFGTENGDEFQCFPLQTSESITAIFSLYRASQVSFPGEKLLEKAYEFSYRHLSERQAKNQLCDKWVILKDLPGEVRYALDMPWYASLPRVEARFYIDQYGGSDEVWIGKTLNRMYEVSNNEYLELAKLDFNKCQAQHQMEWNDIQKWYRESNLREHGICRDAVILAYFLAAANLFEPERSNERMSWAKSAILVQMIASYFNNDEISGDQKNAFVDEFRSNHTSINYSKSNNYKTEKQGSLVKKLVGTLRQISADTLLKHGRDIYGQLYQSWEAWLMNLNNGGAYWQEAELLMLPITLCGSHSISDTTLMSKPQYYHLLALTNKICHQLYIHRNNKVRAMGICNSESGKITSAQIESDMQELVELVLDNSSDGIEPDVKQTFLTIARSFYYTAYTSPETIRTHIAKVLFEELV